jgi:hypothetical protein
MIPLFQKNQAKMRLCRHMIGTDRERPAIRCNGGRWLPGGAQRIAQTISDIGVFGFQARGAAARRNRLIVAAESPERVAEIARICGATRRQTDRYFQQLHRFLESARLGLEHAKKVARVGVPGLDTQDFLVQRRRLSGTIGAMMRQGCGKGILDIPCTGGPVGSTGLPARRRWLLSFH